MNQSLLKRIILVALLMLAAAVPSWAKGLKVGSFAAEEKFYVDTDIPKDNNGNKCALLRVFPPEGVKPDQIKVAGNVVKTVPDVSELKCYISARTKRVDINVAGYDPLTVNFAEVGDGIKIQNAMAYNLKLMSGNKFDKIENGDGLDDMILFPVDGDYTLVFYVGDDLHDMNYLDAKKFCEGLNERRQGGYTGWRLPTINEMLFFFGDYPEYANDFQWVGYEGVIINNRTVEEEERSGHTRYTPCITNVDLKVHRYYVNSRGQFTRGELFEHGFFPCTIIYP